MKVFRRYNRNWDDIVVQDYNFLGLFDEAYCAKLLNIYSNVVYATEYSLILN